jgi:hypothetical protein
MCHGCLINLTLYIQQQVNKKNLLKKNNFLVIIYIFLFLPPHPLDIFCGMEYHKKSYGLKDIPNIP